MSSTVDWDTARSIAGRFDRRSSDDPPYHASSTEADFAEVTPLAEELVAAETGLPQLAGPAKARVIDRAGWVDANLAAFERLLRPLLGKLSEDEPRSEPTSTAGRLWGRAVDFAEPVTSQIGPKVAAGELGMLLGWMSGRVLGQYDLLVIDDERPDDQDWVYYVGPNIAALEQRHGFPTWEFRLWIAAHECTHRAQFTGVPWLRPYFLSQVNDLLDSVEGDPDQIFGAARRMVDRRRNGNGNGDGAADGGLASLLASPAQRETLDRMTGLMSLLEGHGDIVMDRATADLIPNRARFARVMSERRKNAKGFNKVVQRLVGIEAKLAQYEEGAAFIHAVEAHGGRELFDQVWISPEYLPNLAEIQDPQVWIRRVGA